MSHLVILSVAPKLAVHEVGRDIARALRRPMADVTRRLRDCRGLIDLELTEVDAEIVQSILARKDIQSEVVDGARVPALGKPIALLDADPGPDGLEVQQTVSSEGTGLVPWEQIRIAATGTVTFTPILNHSFLSGDALDAADAIENLRQSQEGFGLGFAFPGSIVSNAPRSYTLSEKRRPNSTPETVTCLDLVTADGITRYRIVTSRFVYDYLGDRMRLASRDNFRTLLEDIAEYSPETLLSSTTLSFLENPKSREHRFGSKDEFEAYVRWLTAWDVVFG